MKRSLILSLFLWLCLPFSRFINRINWRFGRSFSCTCKNIDSLRDQLHAGAVILTHKKYEFSTLFIPGYWTHSAVVASPGSIVEATGNGVCMKTLESFFSTVDDFIVLRPRFCCPDVMMKAGEQASTLVGYPFSFDFRNSDKMFYCSGLICWVYTRILIERKHSPDIPLVFRNFLNGNIIKPMDLYGHQDAWQVIGSFKDHRRPDGVFQNPAQAS